MIKVSLIISIRIENKNNYYLFDRLDDLLKSLPNRKYLEVIVVNSGSIPEYTSKIEKLVLEYNFRYLYFDSYGKVFSIGESRDYGVIYSSGNIISFFDVDFRVKPDFWDNVFDLLVSYGYDKYKNNIFAIPMMYISEQETDNYIFSNEYFNNLYLKYLITNDTDTIESFANCSPFVFINKDYYMSLGGHNKAFVGHGFEDFELYLRILVTNNIFPLPTNVSLDKKKWNTYTYDGLRSYLTLLSRVPIYFNLYAIHLWHPRSKSLSFYNHSSNSLLLKNTIESFIKNPKNPIPLIRPSVANKNNLFISCSFNSNVYNCIRSAVPYLGNFVFIDENYFFLNNQFNSILLKDYIAHNKIDTVFFSNPYTTKNREVIYKFLKKEKIKFCCFERGALADSWFFDVNGFNADSSTYNESNWININVDKDNLTNQIREILSFDALEYQSNQVGIDFLIDKYNLYHKKILFVPLQRSNDTVVKFFNKNFDSYLDFCKFVDDLAFSLKLYGWETICKKHPLENNIYDFKNTICITDNTNFLDLIELSNSVLLLNSGVGVYSMIFNKKCYILGDAFYKVDGVNLSIELTQISNYEEKIKKCSDIINDGYIIDVDKRDKFLSYLINNVYSFGVSKTEIKKLEDGTVKNITKYIDFYKLRYQNETLFEYSKNPIKYISKSCPLFERFKLDIIQKGSNNAKKTQIVISEKLNIRKKRTAKKLFNKLIHHPVLYCKDSKIVLLKYMATLYERYIH